MQKKYNVSFKYMYPFPTQDLCIGTVPADKVNSLFRKLSKNNQIPSESCIYTLTLHCRNNKTLPLTRLSGNTSLSFDNNLDIHFTTNPRCKCQIEECLRNLAAGECSDKFMIENIGKKFFADKYKDNNTNQR